MTSKLYKVAGWVGMIGFATMVISAVSVFVTCYIDGVVDVDKISQPLVWWPFVCGIVMVVMGELMSIPENRKEEAKRIAVMNDADRRWEAKMNRQAMSTFKTSMTIGGVIVFVCVLMWLMK